MRSAFWADRAVLRGAGCRRKARQERAPGEGRQGAGRTCWAGGATGASLGREVPGARHRDVVEAVADLLGVGLGLGLGLGLAADLNPYPNPSPNPTPDPHPNPNPNKEDLIMSGLGSGLGVGLGLG